MGIWIRIGKISITTSKVAPLWKGGSGHFGNDDDEEDDDDGMCEWDRVKYEIKESRDRDQID